jgi:response regulator RpfG family c-di-GMP phosphodiesterase
VEHELIAVAVDDEPVILTVLEEIAREANIKVIGFQSPEEALPFILSNEIDMVFTDYRMSSMDGIDFIRELRKISSDIPIVMVTVYDDYSTMVEAIEAGATEFVPKPINAVEFLARVRNLAALRLSQLMLKEKMEYAKREISSELDTVKEREEEAIILLGHALLYQQTGDDAHDIRVARYARLIARSSGVDRETQERVHYSALFHDIGERGVSHDLLLREGILSDEEMNSVKEHALIGSRILDEARNPFLREGGLVALTHHERYDGSGYPRGLKGEEIPFSGRVVALADVFDSLTSKKTYRTAWDFNKAVDFIKDKSGSFFDPRLVDSFIRSIEDVRDIYRFRTR